MRIAIVFPLAIGALLVAPGAVTAAPLVLSDHAALTKTVAGERLEPVAHRYVRKRRANWTSLPYWRPYQYYYWQQYYPYGGPLF